MSCAAVMLPPTLLETATTSKVFRGDSDDMVDRLVKACQEAKAPVASNYTGFGRALQTAHAWLPEDTDPELCCTTRASAGSPSLKKGPSINTSSKKFPQGSHKHARSSPTKGSGASSMPSSPEHKRGGAVCVQPKRNKTTASCGALAAADSTNKAATPSSSPFACPAFAASPKPEAVPMPTSSLLTRALRARSPSPDKASSPGALLLQQLQAVRA